MAAAYAAEGPDEDVACPDVDVALRALRAALEPEHGRGFAFVNLVDVR